MKKPNSTRRLVLAALMAALTMVGSYIRIVIPIDIAGTTEFHLGNIFCALSGLLLGPWLGGLAAGLGSFLYDMTNPLYISEAWMTFLMKGAYGLVAGGVAYLGTRRWGYIRAAVGTVLAAATYAALYLTKGYFYDCIFLKGLTSDAALIGIASKIPATIFNAAVAIIFAPVLAVAIRKALEKNHLNLD